MCKPFELPCHGLGPRRFETPFTDCVRSNSFRISQTNMLDLASYSVITEMFFPHRIRSKSLTPSSLSWADMHISLQPTRVRLVDYFIAPVFQVSPLLFPLNYVPSVAQTPEALPHRKEPVIYFRKNGVPLLVLLTGPLASFNVRERGSTKYVDYVFVLYLVWVVGV